MLPATAIKEANDIAIVENKEITKRVTSEIKEILSPLTKDTDSFTVINMNGTKLSGPQLLENHLSFKDENYQHLELLGTKKTLVNLTLDSYEIKSYLKASNPINKNESFKIIKANDKIDTLENEHYKVTFNEQMFITSFYDKKQQLDVVKGKFNRLSISKHVPLLWDTWDMDKDYQFNLKDVNHLLSTRVVSNGPLACVIEVVYQITEKSSLTQNIVFYNDIPRVDFFTKIDWQDEYYILKTFFDTNIHSSHYKSEIQFGYETRNTHNNASTDQAQFEVMNH